MQTTKAISDCNRVKIIKMLQKRSLYVCEIKAALNIAQPTVSKHLKILEEAGFVNHSKKGLWVNYTLTDGNKNQYVASLLGNLKHWLEDEPEIIRLKNSLDIINRESSCH